MNYEFSEQERQVVERIRETVAKVVNDLYASSDKGGRAAAEAVRAITAALAEDAAAESYLSAGLSPDNPAGAGTMAAMEAFAAVSPEIFILHEMSLRGVGRLIALYGNQKQQDKFLQPLQNGQKTGAVALTEETMNVVNDPLTTSAERLDHTVRVSGGKSWVLGGAAADVLAVIGRLDEGLGIFLVDRHTDGLGVNEYPVGGSFLPAGTCRLSLEDCRLPLEAVIGPLDPEKLSAAIRLWEDQALIAAATGTMGAALFAATAHAKTHRSGGKPVIAYQEVGFKLAEMFTLVQTSQLMACKAAWLAAGDDKDMAVFTGCAKVFCAEAAETVASGAMSILAGYGLDADNPAAAAYRWAKFLQIAGTSTEISRMVIGQAVLK